MSLESGTPLGPGFFIFFQQETGNLGRHEYRSRYNEKYEGGILSNVFTRYVDPIYIKDETSSEEIRVPEQEVIKHLKEYVRLHSLALKMSNIIIREIAKRPDLVKKIEKSQGLRLREAREILFEALLEDLTFKVEKDEEDIALLMILIEVI